MLIDTIIFLEVFLNQAKANDCLIFLEKVDRGEFQGFVTDFTIHSIAVVLERAGRGDFMPQGFASLSSFQGLTLLHASLLEHSEMLFLLPN
jgi:hypothetical protein